MSGGERYDYKKIMMTIINAYNKKENDLQFVNYTPDDKKPVTGNIRFRLIRKSYKDTKKKAQVEETNSQLHFISLEAPQQLVDCRQYTPAPNAYHVVEQFTVLNRKTPRSIHQKIRYINDNNPNLSPQSYNINPEITRFGKKPHLHARVYWDNDQLYQ